MKYEYQKRDVDPLPGEIGPQFVYEPIVLVRVIGPSGAWLVPGLLDTGAAETLIPIGYLKRLGIAQGPRFQLAAAGGSMFPAWLGTVDLEIGDGKNRHCWSTRVGFTPWRNNAIWGHAGFLQFFTATFNGRKRSVSLQSNDTFTPPIYADLTF